MSVCQHQLKLTMFEILFSTTFYFLLRTVITSAISFSEYNMAVNCPPCSCHITQGEIIADCSSKGLSSVPQSLPRNITQLNITSNGIYSLTNSLKSYVFLRLLNISSNSLRYLQKDDFVALSHLHTLDLHNNHLRLSPKTYPLGLFRRQERLEVLLLHKNSATEGTDLHYPDQAFKDLVSLKELHLDGLRNFVLGKGFMNMTNLTTLSFDGYCSIRNLSDNAFRNVFNVRFLDVSNCQIIHIEQSAFENLQHIHTLNISDNVDLGTSKLGRGLYGLQNSSLKVLKANNLHRNHGMGVFLSKKDIQYLAKTELEELHFKECRLELIDPEVPLTLPLTLRFIDVSKNMLLFGLYLVTSSYMTGLTTVHASYQCISHASPFLYPQEKHSREYSEYFDNDLDTSADSKLTNRFIQRYNSFGNLTVFVPPNGEYLDLSHSKLSFSIPEISFGPNNLKFLNLAHNFFNSWEGPVIGLNSLENVDLSNNYCDVISDNFLRTFQNLKILKISNNFLGFALTNNTFQSPALRLLDISQNKINKLPKSIFKYAKALQSLSISHNYITTWDTNIGHLANLTYLDLSNNLLEEIPVKLRLDIDQISKPELVVRLINNPFICNCDTLPSLKWLDKSGRSMIDVEGIFCNMENINTSLENLHEIVLNLEKNCASYVGVMVGMVGLIVLVLSLTVGGLVYRYRWKLRYLYHVTRNRHRGYLPTREQEEQFEFDAFISYADEDRGLVIGDMRRTLEDQEGLRLCIHHRDFLAGEAIASNILNAVASSRKTVVILSKNFLKSYWCKYEVEMAKMEGISTGRNTLLIVVLENVSVKNLFSDIVVKMKEESYIEYTEDPEGQIVFWQSLKRAICSV